MGKARSVPYKNKDSALDDGYLDGRCTQSRDKDAPYDLKRGALLLISFMSKTLFILDIG
jgi:hypothetical protein